jgi:hypothetical protein
VANWRNEKPFRARQAIIDTFRTDGAQKPLGSDIVQDGIKGSKRQSAHQLLT